jgi:hypothetical protein
MTPHTLRHATITAALNAGAHLRDVQDFARHADPKTTRRYDRNPHSLDRHAAYAIAQYLAGGPPPACRTPAMRPPLTVAAGSDVAAVRR